MTLWRRLAGNWYFLKIILLHFCVISFVNFQVHGDVFRPPPHQMILVNLVGTGIQLIGMVATIVCKTIRHFSNDQAANDNNYLEEKTCKGNFKNNILQSSQCLECSRRRVEAL